MIQTSTRQNFRIEWMEPNLKDFPSRLYAPNQDQRQTKWRIIYDIETTPELPFQKKTSNSSKKRVLQETFANKKILSGYIAGRFLQGPMEVDYLGGHLFNLHDYFIVSLTNVDFIRFHFKATI